MLETTLLVLTLTASGDVRVTLSYAKDATECSANRDAVTTILTEAGHPPLVALCGATDLKLTPFVHGTPPEAETSRYRVELPGTGGFLVVPLAADAPCKASADTDPAVYCAISAQKVIADG